MLAVFQRSVWARVGVLILVGIALTAALMPASDRQAWVLLLAKALGLFLPALLLGSAWGWIKYSWSSWVWATAIFAALTVVLLIWNPSGAAYF